MKHNWMKYSSIQYNLNLWTGTNSLQDARNPTQHRTTTASHPLRWKKNDNIVKEEKKQQHLWPATSVSRAMVRCHEPWPSNAVAPEVEATKAIHSAVKSDTKEYAQQTVERDTGACIRTKAKLYARLTYCPVPALPSEIRDNTCTLES